MVAREGGVDYSGEEQDLLSGEWLEENKIGGSSLNYCRGRKREYQD